MTTTITAERAAQIADIIAAFDFHAMTVAAIEYDDDAEIINVYTVDNDHYDFQIGSDDDCLTFTNVADSTDVVTVAIPAE